MSPPYSRYRTFCVPDGYTTIPLVESCEQALLRIGVLVRTVAEPVAGHFVILREDLDCRTFLGCIMDASGRVLEWTELCVQTMAGLDGAAAIYREAVPNSVLDDRWRTHADTLETLDAGGLIRTGWESSHPLPSFVDMGQGVVVHPGDAVGVWRLCENDELLRSHELPPYSSTGHRYLSSPEAAKGEAMFVPVTPGAPTNARTVSWEHVLENHAGLIPFNPEGGLILVRRHAAMGLAEYLAVLAGGPWQGVTHGAATLDVEGFGGALHSADDPGRLFLARHGRGGRLLESLYLRLRALVDVLESVRSLVSQQQRPLLNISDESFRVHFSGMGTGLPLLWTAHVGLIDAGDAVPLRISTSDIVHYVRPETRFSVFRPASEGLPSRGRGELRIRQLLKSGSAGVVVEGTFRGQDELRVAPHDLVWLRVGLAHGTVDFYGRMEEDRAMAQGEMRFRSVEQAWSEEMMAGIKAAEGVPLPDVPFEVLPLVSTPSDLYALAVIGVRLLLVNGDTTLPVALDETISIAREASASGVEDQELTVRLAELFANDSRWASSLGPQRLAAEALLAEDAFALVPAALWMEVVALLVRMLPGIGRFSTCADYGDASPGALDLVFEAPLKHARDLLLETRSLIVTDWDQNREMRALISTRLAETGH